MKAWIEPLRLARAHALLDEHREKGHFLLIITATNRFITEPIAELLGVDDLLATDAELLDGRYTGRVAGTPCFREGKVTRLEQRSEERRVGEEGGGEVRACSKYGILYTKQ